jgi:hypothetical protein
VNLVLVLELEYRFQKFDGFHLLSILRRWWVFFESPCDEVIFLSLHTTHNYSTMTFSSALIWSLAAAPASSFLSPSLPKLYSAPLLSTALDDGITTDSKRLVKAKKLLQELMVENVDAAISIIPDTTTTAIVPETYWSNGHLQGSNNYVTRWARGVKVAEPLVRYDPVAAEKLLFRQPGKWLVRNIQIAFPIGWWAARVVTDYYGSH